MSNSTTISNHIQIKDTNWHTFTKQIHAPAGTTKTSITVYSYAADGKKEILTHYDNFYLIELPPDIADNYYFVSEPSQAVIPVQTGIQPSFNSSLQIQNLDSRLRGNDNSLNLEKPKSVDFEILSPTKKKIRIRGASTPFYLAMSESYHDQWRLELDNNKIAGFLRSWIPWVHPDQIPDSQHFKLDDFLNGWYIDPAKLCTESSSISSGEILQGCKKNEDGTYDLNMIIEFSPQRYFYVGLIVSALTLISCIGYLGHEFVKRKKIKQ